jgi:hypothetical protein
MSDDTTNGLDLLWWTGLRITSDRLRYRMVELDYRYRVMRRRRWIRRRDLEEIDQMIRAMMTQDVFGLEATVRAHPVYGHRARDMKGHEDE